MPAHEYRADLLQALAATVREYTARLVDLRQATLDEMRFNQGVIEGLNIAIDLERDMYRRMVGG